MGSADQTRFKSRPSDKIEVRSSGAQRLTIAQRLPIVEALLQHEEDAQDQNLPLMYWYAAEPLVAADIRSGATLAAKSKIPRVREYISRRMAASVTK